MLWLKRIEIYKYVLFTIGILSFVFCLLGVTFNLAVETMIKYGSTHPKLILLLIIIMCWAPLAGMKAYKLWKNWDEEM